MVGYKLGLGGPYYHDASACLVAADGAVLAFIEEERLTRRKHNKDSRSCSRSAAYCLAEAGIELADVDEIAVAWNPLWPAPADNVTDSNLIRELLDPDFFSSHTPTRLTIIDHHLAHAAAAFYLSGFSESAVLVVDGSGDGVSTSIYHGTADGLRVVRQFPFTQSLGWFYESVAEHLGLGDWTSSGKLMGLAAYGQPIHDLPFVRSDGDDGYLIDLSRYGLSLGPVATANYANLQYYHDLKRAYGAAFTDLGVPVQGCARGYDLRSGRIAGVGAFTQGQADLAASAQRTLEQRVLALAQAALRQTGSARPLPRRWRGPELLLEWRPAPGKWGGGDVCPTGRRRCGLRNRSGAGVRPSCRTPLRPR